MKKHLLLALVAAFVGRVGWAQDAETDLSSVPPPRAPYVARMADKSAWTIEFLPTSTGSTPAAASPGSKPAGKQLKQQDWTKSNGLIKCVNEWSDGTSTEDWVIGSSLYSQDAKGAGIHIYSPKSDPRYHDFSVSDFKMLDWITAKDYDRAVKHGDEICYLFSAKTLSTSPAEYGSHNKSLSQLNAPATPTTVLISVHGGLPVEIDNGDGKFIYHYLPTPTGELKLPAPFLVMWRSYREH